MQNADTISQHLMKIDNKNETKQIKNVDFVYLINLDKRPDRLKRCIEQLEPYNILPHRIPAINGWQLDQKVFNNIHMKISSSMVYDKPVQYYFVPGGTTGKPFDPSLEGVSCLHEAAPAGYAGCSLSHLSIVNDGHLSNYDVIWVLEDDFTVNGNPHLLTQYIEDLNALVGVDGWDVLYTDDDDHFTASNILLNFGKTTWLRPGIPMTKELIERKAIGEHFYKIGGRTQAHSYLLSRSGMKKILEFVKNQGFFLPYDTELPCIPNIKLFNLKYDLIHGRDRKYSDTWVQNP